MSCADFQGIGIPSATQGPHHLSAAAPSGYDRTGAGAALAAISATVRMSVATDDQWPAVSQLLAAGPARDTWAVNRAQVSITAAVPPAKAPKVLGYTVDSYTADRAVIGIVTRQHDNSLTRNTATVTWAAAGDWLLELPAANATASAVTALTALPAHLITLPCNK